MKLEYKIASPPPSVKEETRQPDDSLSFALTRKAWKSPRFCSVGAPFSCRASAVRRPCRSQDSQQLPGAPSYPPRLHPANFFFFFCATMHAFPRTMRALFIRIPAPGCHYTLSSSATMGAFLSPPRPPLFPAESPAGKLFFVATFNEPSQLLPRLVIESEARCHALRYKGQIKAHVSFTCRAMTAKSQHFPLGNGLFSTLTNGVLLGLHSGEITGADTRSS